VGQDLSIVFAAKKIADESLIQSAQLAFADEGPDNLVLLIASSGPPSVERVFPAFTAVSLWSDAELGLAQFAAELSRRYGACAVLTLADHACVGGWQIFERGRPGRGEWIEGGEYTAIGIRGIETAFGVCIKPNTQERTLFVDAFVDDPKGVCVFGSAEGLSPGKRLAPEQVRAILEFDMPGAELECL
jgi:hypothetical protein